MHSPNRLRLLIALLVVITASSTAFAQDEYAAIKRWESFDFASQTLAPADVANVMPENLALIRGIVFGRHGRVFKDWEIKNYLKSRAWYKPNPEFTNALLNATERQNLDVIRFAEAEHHETVQPGDMRIYKNRLLTRRKLGTHTNAECCHCSQTLETRCQPGRVAGNSAVTVAKYDEEEYHRVSPEYQAKNRIPRWEAEPNYGLGRGGRGGGGGRGGAEAGRGGAATAGRGGAEAGRGGPAISFPGAAGRQALGKGLEGLPIVKPPYGVLSAIDFGNRDLTTAMGVMSASGAGVTILGNDAFPDRAIAVEDGFGRADVLGLADVALFDRAE